MEISFAIRTPIQYRFFQCNSDNLYINLIYNSIILYYVAILYYNTFL